VFDCECDSGTTSGNPGDTRDNRIDFMQFTVICALAMPTDMIERKAPVEEILQHSTKHTWWRDVAEHGSNPVVTLLELFDGAELIVGYNCLGFDFPLIRRFYRPSAEVLYPTQRYVNHRTKTLDIMHRVSDATGHYYKLDDLLKKNGLQTKSSNGKEAIRMWEEGRRDELKSYCEQDVLLTARLGLLESIRIAEHLKVTSRGFGIRSELCRISPSVASGADPDGDFVMV